MQKFFVVIRDGDGKMYFSKRHPTFDEALLEAERLAHKEYPSLFLVLGLVGAVVPVPSAVVKWEAAE